MQSPQRGPYGVAPSYGPATDDTFSNLQLASQSVEEKLSKDETVPELSSQLSSTTLSGTFQDYVFEERPQLFHKKDVRELPPALYEQYGNLQWNAFMGLFPEIGRAWMTIDNQLFLWNYKDGRDFLVYNQLSQIIIAAALVKPRPNVFVEQIKHLLVLATPVEVVLLAVEFSGGTPDGEMTLIPTNMSIASDNVNMLKIVGLDNGRIFMCGKDGALYELVYQGSDSWFFSRKCRKISHNSNRLAAYVPSFLKWGQEHPLIDIAVDKSRNILYTLNNKSTIDVYDLGLSGQEFEAKSKFDKIVAAFEQIGPKNIPWNPANLRLVSISAVTLAESGAVQLVAVANNGVRFFFSTLKREDRQWRSDDATLRPSNLELLHIRMPPPSAPPPVPAANGAPYGIQAKPEPFTLYPDVHATFYSQGVMLMSNSRENEPGDTVLCTQPLAFVPKSQNPWGDDRDALQLRERTAALAVDGKVMALDEAPTKLPEPLKLPDKVLRSELATQHLFPPRQFLCLTNSGLHVLVKLRPVDQLQEILMSKSRDSDALLQQFFERYGEDQACAMCLILACSNPQSVAPGSVLSPTRSAGPGAPVSPISQQGMSAGPRFSPRAPDPSVASLAARTFFKYGGRPYFAVPQQTLGQPTGAYGYALQSPDMNFVYSHAYQGFVLYLSRLLRPIWKQKITRNADGAAQPGGVVPPQVPAIKPEGLAIVEESLSLLKVFLAKNPHFAAPPGTTATANLRTRMLTMQKRKVDEDAAKREQHALSALHQLLDRSIEAINFIAILSDPRHKFGDLFKSLPADVQQRVANATFKDLAISPEGMTMSRPLVNALINVYTANPSISVDEITSELRERCPDFFSEADRTRFKGREALEAAKQLKASPEREAERRRLLDQSLELFMQRSIAENVELELISADYAKLRYYTGIVQLALAKAKAIDPQGVALAYYNNPNAHQAARRVHEAVLACYNVAVTALTELSQETPAGSPDKVPITEAELDALQRETLRQALSSDDELFHYVLYRWYIDRGLANELVNQVDAPFLEAFLRKVQLADLLWRYYVRVGKPEAAALILSRLAEGKAPAGTRTEPEELTLGRRVEYLSRAVTQGGNTTTMQELQEKLDVAKVQLKVQETLRAQGNAEAVRELDAELLDLSSIFNKYALKYKLWEVQLDVLHMSGHDDEILVRRVWEGLVNTELEQWRAASRVPPNALGDGLNGTASGKGILPTLEERLRSIVGRFHPSHVVPLAFLVDFLERISLNLKQNMDWSLNWVVRALLSSNVPHHVLFEVYHRTLSKEFWSTKPNQFHMLCCIHEVLNKWFDFLGKRASQFDRLQFPAKQVASAIDEYVTMLHKSQESGREELLGSFRDLRDIIVAPSPFHRR